MGKSIVIVRGGLQYNVMLTDITIMEKGIGYGSLMRRGSIEG